MNEKEFNIKSRSETFRIIRIEPTEMLALSMVVDLDDYRKSEVLFTFALEHMQVKMGEVWNPVKVKDKHIYMPMGLENDIKALQELGKYFLDEVLAKAF